MSNLLALLQQLQLKLDRFRKEGLKETPTRTIFIDPILDALGWDVRNPDEVQLEYPTIDGKSVDYALKINCKPVLLLEAKALNDSLNDVKDITQITSYAANNGIVWCILTNGVRWQVYRSIEQCLAPEKLMYQVSYDQKDLEGMSLDHVVDQFQRFSKDQIPKGVLDLLAEQVFTDGKVRKALVDLVNDPPGGFLKLIRKRTGDKTLRPQTLKKSLARVLAPMLGAVRIKDSGYVEGKPSNRPTAALKAAATRKAKRGSVYSEEMHTEGKPTEVLEIYRKLDQFCLGLRSSGIAKQFLAKYIAYRDGKRVFCSVHLQQGGIRLWLKLDFQKLTNPPAFARDVTKVGHWGSGDLELQITSSQQLPDAFPLIRRAFEEL